MSDVMSVIDLKKKWIDGVKSFASGKCRANLTPTREE